MLEHSLLAQHDLGYTLNRMMMEVTQCLKARKLASVLGTAEICKHFFKALKISD